MTINRRSEAGTRYWVLVRKFLQNRKQPFTELFLYISAKGLVDLHFVTPLAVWGSVWRADIHVQHEGQQQCTNACVHVTWSAIHGE